MALITKKKLLYPINAPLRSYLADHERNADAIDYEELTRYTSAIMFLFLPKKQVTIL